MHDQSLQDMFKRRTFLRGMYGRNPGAMRPDPSQPIALPPRQPEQMPQMMPRIPQPGRPMPAPMPQPGVQEMFRRRRFLQGARPIQAAERGAAMGLAGGMAGHAAGVGFAAFLQKYPLVGRLFGR